MTRHTLIKSTKIKDKLLKTKQNKTNKQKKNPSDNAEDTGDAGTISRLGQSPGGGSSILA